MNRLRRRLAITDGGFSLVETVVALGIMVPVLLALLASAVFALRSTVNGRQNQAAGDFLNQSIESARSLDYGAVSMRTSDLTGDSSIVTVAGVPKYDPGTGQETVDASAVGVITPHVASTTTPNGRFTVKRYVTVPSTATFNALTGEPSVRRLTVVVSWTNRGISHTRKAGTMLTRTRRGLQLPYFTWKYNGPASLVSGVPTWGKNPGNAVDYGFVLTNLGARDSWTLSASPATPAWSFYLDTDHDGLWDGDATVEPLLATANTGVIEAGSSPLYVVASRTISLAELGTSTTSFRATSDAQTSVYKSVTTSLTVASGVVVVPTPTPTATASATPSASASAPAIPCTPGTATGVTDSGASTGATTSGQYTLARIYALNGTAAGDTATLSPALLSTNAAALQSTPCNYSTDVQTNQAGRLLSNTGSTTATVAEFQFQPASAVEDQYKGTAAWVMYVQCPTSVPTLTVKMFSKSGTTYTQRGSSTTVTATGCTASGFLRVDALVSIPNGFSIGLSDRLVVRVLTNTPVRLLYGTTAAQSRLTIGMK